MATTILHAFSARRRVSWKEMRGVMEVASSMMAMACVKEKVNVSFAESVIYQWHYFNYIYTCHGDPFQYQFWIPDEFEMNEGGSCTFSNTYNSYALLPQAELACSSDKKCIGIYVKDCDPSNSYRLCRGGFFKERTQSSCILHKKIYDGKCQSYLFFKIDLWRLLSKCYSGTLLHHY